ncbi:MAG: sugar ABC transporter permease [Propionibacteriaceae bacterium]|jgi:glucose/mannose transport system permease protein|nr:sugar ABC transporter permease [Propionibacteriaceae bacterium]
MRKLKSHLPPILMVSPSLILIGIFVYYLIFGSVKTSMTDTHELAQVTGKAEVSFVGLENYTALLTNPDFLHSLRNLLQYTVAFIGGTMILGFLWAWLLDRRSKAEGVFRSLYLFPMAVSSVAAGVVWKWLLNSNVEGENVSGLNALFDLMGLGFLKNTWTFSQDWGILAIALPAIWQMSGYIMALFLAGFRGIPDELREAARVDGANEWKIYRHVLFPQLSPIALSALIVLAHMSLKIFDLVVAITGGYTFYPTKVPAVDMAFFLNGGDYANASAVGVILLLIILVMIVPYLVHVAKEDK